MGQCELIHCRTSLIFLEHISSIFPRSYSKSMFAKTNLSNIMRSMYGDMASYIIRLKTVVTGRKPLSADQAQTSRPRSHYIMYILVYDYIHGTTWFTLQDTTR